MGELKSPGKPFEISKWAVREAFEKVKANKGAPGVDGVSIEEFEADLQNNLYKVWNRMSSGSYFPPPTHQRLPDAVGPQEIPAVSGPRGLPTGVAAGHHPAPAVLRPLGMGHRCPESLVIKVTRAV
ncbi:hypothetical protein [Mycobacterium celatum]|uniref:Group II intron reverse transcriptase/maturase n=1 Tax=Mycobacterium celatum TaxID=28045 RepID=A0A1X1RSC2_MYCCE|nr:hypothetical protein [Mycobacterium celatum]ORV14646.1 hypothetical protein AWB95_08425 [Mycobacterium celatum]